MTLASLHQVLTLRMSPSSRHPRLTPWLPAACAPCSCSLLLPSGEPLALPPSSSPSACAPGHSLHLSGWHKGTRLTCTCAAYTRPQSCPRARGACSTSTPQHGPKPHTSYVGSSVAGLSGAGWWGTRTGRGSAGAWSAFHIVEVFLAGKAQLAPSSPQLPCCIRPGLSFPSCTGLGEALPGRQRARWWRASCLHPSPLPWAWLALHSLSVVRGSSCFLHCCPGPVACLPAPC